MLGSADAVDISPRASGDSCATQVLRRRGVVVVTVVDICGLSVGHVRPVLELGGGAQRSCGGVSGAELTAKSLAE